MGNYTQLKNIITAAINSNGNQEITGQSLQDTLLSIISSIGANASYGGIATVSTNPTAVDQNVFYLAFESGTYTNFNNLVLDANSWGIFSYSEGWQLHSTISSASAEKVWNPAVEIPLPSGSWYTLETAVATIPENIPIDSMLRLRIVSDHNGAYREYKRNLSIPDSTEDINLKWEQVGSMGLRGNIATYSVMGGSKPVILDDINISGSYYISNNITGIVGLPVLESFNASQVDDWYLTHIQSYCPDIFPLSRVGAVQFLSGVYSTNGLPSRMFTRFRKGINGPDEWSEWEEIGPRSSYFRRIPSSEDMGSIISKVPPEFRNPGFMVYDKTGQLKIWTGNKSDFISPSSPSWKVIPTESDLQVILNSLHTEISGETDQKIQNLKNETQDNLAEAIASIPSGEGATGTIISRIEKKIGTYSVGSVELDLYEQTIVAADAPSTTWSVDISSSPLGLGKYLSIQGVSLSSDSGFVDYNNVWSLSVEYSPNLDTYLKFTAKTSETTVYPLVHVRIQYIKLETKTVELTVDTKDETVRNLNDYRVYIPDLKYGKKGAFSLVIRDTPSVYGYLGYDSDKSIWIDPQSGKVLSRKFGNTSPANGNVDRARSGFVGISSYFNNSNVNLLLKSTTGKYDPISQKPIYAPYKATLAINPTSLGTGDDNDMDNSQMNSKEYTDYLRYWGYDVISESLGNYESGEGKVKFDTEYLKMKQEFSSSLGEIPFAICTPSDGYEDYITYSKSKVTLTPGTGQNFYPTKEFSGVGIRTSELPSGVSPDVNYISEISEVVDTVNTRMSSPFWSIYESTGSQVWQRTLLETLYEKFGDLGEDNLWVCGVQEFYEYIFLRNTTVIKKSLGSQPGQLKLTVAVPVIPEFKYSDLTIMVEANSEDAANTSSLSVQSGDIPVAYMTVSPFSSGTRTYTVNISTSNLLKDSLGELMARVGEYGYYDQHIIQMYEKLAEGSYKDSIKAQIGEGRLGYSLINFEVTTPYGDINNRKIETSVTFPTGKVESFMVSTDPTFKGERWRQRISPFWNGFNYYYTIGPDVQDSVTLYCKAIYLGIESPTLSSTYIFSQTGSTIYGIDHPSSTETDTFRFIPDITTNSAQAGKMDRWKVEEDGVSTTWTTGAPLPVSYTLRDKTTLGKRALKLYTQIDVPDLPLPEIYYSDKTVYIWNYGSSTAKPSLTVTQKAPVPGFCNDPKVVVTLKPSPEVTQYRLSFDPEMSGAEWLDYEGPTGFDEEGELLTLDKYFIPSSPMINGQTYKVYAQVRISPSRESNIVETTSFIHYTPPVLGSVVIGDGTETIVTGQEYSITFNYLYGSRPTHYKLETNLTPATAWVPYEPETTPVKITFKEDYDNMIRLQSIIIPESGAEMQMPWFYEHSGSIEVR